MKNFLLHRAVPLGICLILGIFAYILKFCLPGYGFSALVCCGIIAVILFYTFVPLVATHAPVMAGVLTKVVTLCLIIGLLVAGITEAVIIKASFGSPKEQVQYMVVLGAKVRTSGPSVSLWDRIYAAADYMNAHPEVIAVVSGGQGPDEPMPEGQAMYEELIKLGIAPDRIWVEDRSSSTWGNICYSLDLIEAKTGQRPEKIGVVSSEYHLFRAGLLTKEAGADFVGIPAHTSRLSQMINHFMREVAGVWHYILLGGQYD